MVPWLEDWPSFLFGSAFGSCSVSLDANIFCLQFCSSFTAVLSLWVPKHDGEMVCCPNPWLTTVDSIAIGWGRKLRSARGTRCVPCARRHGSRVVMVVCWGAELWELCHLSSGEKWVASAWISQPCPGEVCAWSPPTFPPKVVRDTASFGKWCCCGRLQRRSTDRWQVQGWEQKEISKWLLFGVDRSPCDTIQDQASKCSWWVDHKGFCYILLIYLILSSAKGEIGIMNVILCGFPNPPAPETHQGQLEAPLNQHFKWQKKTSNSFHHRSGDSWAPP